MGEIIIMREIIERERREIRREVGAKETFEQEDCS
jgi:hypothetical protein